MKTIAIIPARYGSSRFEGKPLADILGKPMIWWVYNRVIKAKKIDEVYVATDNSKIYNKCLELGIKVVMTKESHGTSTERVFEVAQNIEADYYVVINGDEPLIDPEIISRVIPNEKISNNEVYVTNLITEMTNAAEVIDFTNIKVVSDTEGNALYMSRNPIPYPKSSIDYSYKKHLGVIGYNLKALQFFDKTKRGYLEKIEDVNEIRFIENGKKLKFIEVSTKTLSVDTPKDLEKVIDIIKNKKISE